MRARGLGWNALGLSFVLALGSALPSGCSVKLVPDYDQASVDRLGTAYERMDRLYESLASAAPVERDYDRYAKEWSGVATELRAIALRQKVREDNEESTEIAETMVRLWEKTRDEHKRASAAAGTTGNPYPDSKLADDRADFEAQFVAAMAAERFKQ